jgi:hypothetical protein
MLVVESISDYLQQLRRFELEPGMIDRRGIDQTDADVRLMATIAHSNRILGQHLIACQDCFYPTNRRAVQVWAAPIHPDFKIDAFCNIRVDPATIVFDVGRVVAADWLKVVAHEYAHAIVGESGHSPRYAAILQHLCLGLGFDVLPVAAWGEADLQVFPACRAAIDPRQFWQEST